MVSSQPYRALCQSGHETMKKARINQFIALSYSSKGIATIGFLCGFLLIGGGQVCMYVGIIQRFGLIGAIILSLLIVGLVALVQRRFQAFLSGLAGILIGYCSYWLFCYLFLVLVLSLMALSDLIQTWLSI